MARVSIRVRLTAWYAVVLLLALAIFGVGMWFALEHRLIAGVDRQLAERVRGLRTVLEVESEEKDQRRLQVELSEFAREVPDGALIQLRDQAGRLILPFPHQPFFPKDYAPGGPRYRTVVKAGRRFRVLTTRIEYGGQSYDTLVASSLDEVRSVVRNFGALLLLMIPLVLATACFGGYWISRRALAPVDEITRVAKSISVQNLSERLQVPQTGDELQRMSETWNEVLERLEGAVKRIRQFTADASHELRTPVALIRATAELALRRQRGAEEYRKALSRIEKEAGRMTELTEALLALARSDAGGCEMPLTPVDLNQVATEAVRQNMPMAQTKGLSLKAELAPGTAMVAANEAGIRRLVLILMDNAFKHTPSGGTVTVSTALENGSIVLAVEDTGEGIPAHALPHVFERFYRGDTARRMGSGAGLGLSIAQAIAQAHGSMITVESTAGAGARFFLAFRRLKAEVTSKS